MYNIIGIPKELKNNEKRVIFTPKDVEKIVKMGFSVIIQKDAGLLSNFSNESYVMSGALIYNNIKDIYNNANIIFKVKEPQEYEYQLIKEHHCICCFYHLGGNENLKNNMIKSKACCIGFESVKYNNEYPILKQMSVLAGKNALNISYNYMQKNIFNKKLVIIGLGNAGQSALYEAISFNFNNIHLMDINWNKLNNLKLINENLNIYEYNIENLKKIMKNADIVIGSIYTNLKQTDKIITDELLDLMHNNSIFVDISIDQGGMTSQSITKTIDDPYNIYNNKSIYCVPNLPALSGKEASELLSDIVFRCFSNILSIIIEKKDFMKNVIINNEKINNSILIDNGIIKI
jgi:alanine dehydrogenase